MQQIKLELHASAR